jgi:hypothetical protein
VCALKFYQQLKGVGLLSLMGVPFRNTSHATELDMRRRDPAPAQDEAEAMALMALTFLAEDPARLGRFLSLTGIGPDDLRRAADAPQTLIAVLDHLMGDESLLLMFAAENGIAAEALVAAHARLTKPARGGAIYD